MRAVALSCLVAMAGRAEQADPGQIARGAEVYAKHCAACHGAKLEGQSNWRQKLPSGRWPAPPHDGSGHTWHHSDHWLCEVVEKEMVPPYAPRGHQSHIPGFGDRLSNTEIRAVLAYIKSRWSEETMRRRSEMLQKRAARAIK